MLPPEVFLPHAELALHLYVFLVLDLFPAVSVHCTVTGEFELVTFFVYVLDNVFVPNDANPDNVSVHVYVIVVDDSNLGESDDDESVGAAKSIYTLTFLVTVFPTLSVIVNLAYLLPELPTTWYFVSVIV